MIPFFVRAVAPERVPAIFRKTRVNRSIRAHFKSEFSEFKLTLIKSFSDLLDHVFHKMKYFKIRENLARTRSFADEKRH